MSRSNKIKVGLIKDAAGKFPQTLSTQQKKLVEAVQYNDNVDEVFDCPVSYSMIENVSQDLFDGTLAAGDELVMKTDKNSFLVHVQSVNGTVANIFPYVSADGLEVPTDANATDGVLGWEIACNPVASDKMVYTVGSTDGRTIMIEATVKIDDVSSSTATTLGWRKVEAFKATLTDYTDYAALQKDGSENIDITHDLNDSGTPTATDTGLNWADGESYTLRIEVDPDGVAKFFVDGTEYASSSGFTFDSGDNIMPFLHHVSETGDPGVSISALKIGYK